MALEALQHHTPVVISERVRIGDYLKGDKGYRVLIITIMRALKMRFLN